MRRVARIVAVPTGRRSLIPVGDLQRETCLKKLRFRYRPHEEPRAARVGDVPEVQLGIHMYDKHAG